MNEWKRVHLSLGSSLLIPALFSPPKKVPMGFHANISASLILLFTEQLYQPSAMPLETERKDMVSAHGSTHSNSWGKQIYQQGFLNNIRWAWWRYELSALGPRGENICVYWGSWRRWHLSWKLNEEQESVQWTRGAIASQTEGKAWRASLGFKKQNQFYIS